MSLDEITDKIEESGLSPDHRASSEEDISISKPLSKGQKKKLSAKRQKERQKEKKVQLAIASRIVPYRQKFKDAAISHLSKTMRELIKRGKIRPETMIPQEVILRVLLHEYKDAPKTYRMQFLNMYHCPYESGDIKNWDKDFERLLEIVRDRKHWFQSGIIPRDNWEGWILSCFRCDGLLRRNSDLSKKKDDVNTEANKTIIIKRLLKFTILAVENDTLPDSFNFETFLKLATKTASIGLGLKLDKHLIYFKKPNSFKPSQFRQLEHILKLGQGLNENFGREKILRRHHQLEIEIEESIHSQCFAFSDKKIFQTVGGKQLWVTCFENLVV